MTSIWVLLKDFSYEGYSAFWFWHTKPTAEQLSKVINLDKDSKAIGNILDLHYVTPDGPFDFGYQEHEEEITECDLWDFFFCQGGIESQRFYSRNPPIAS